MLFAYVRKELGSLKASSSGTLAGGGTAQRAEKDIFGLTPGCTFTIFRVLLK